MQNHVEFAKPSGAGSGQQDIGRNVILKSQRREIASLGGTRGEIGDDDRLALTLVERPNEGASDKSSATRYEDATPPPVICRNYHAST
ncbi:MAG TPA: hypothetical protein VIW93_16240 [Candidatus Acidoferrum sp.]